MELFSPTIVGIVLALLAGLGLFIVIGGLRRIQQERRQQNALPQAAVDPPAPAEEHPPSEFIEATVPHIDDTAGPAAQRRPAAGPSPARSATLSLLRVLMMVGALLGGAVILLIIVPGSWIDWISRYEITNETLEPSEPLLLESMGEERLADQFRVYGTVRNATQQEIVQPRVVVKLYGLDGELIDTTVAPLAVDRLPPEARAEFSVRHMRHSSEISRFSVTFKNPEGEPLPHRDVRGTGRN